MFGLRLFGLDAPALLEATEEKTRLFGLDAQLLFDAAILLVTMLVLYIILSYLLFNPVRQVLEKRKERIDNEKKQAEDDKAAASQLKEEYEAKLKDITIQVWSPFQYGMFEGTFLGSEKYEELNRVIDRIAEKYHVSNTAVATAWILRHPAKMQVIAGTMKKSRIDDICEAGKISLTREEWYELYLAAGHMLP